VNFETALRAQVEKRPRLGLKGRRILSVLNSRPSKRRARILARWEEVATAAVHAQAGTDPGKTGAIDWENIDWKKLFQTILELLLKFLPLFL
jgi:hypothetical protein